MEDSLMRRFRSPFAFVLMLLLAGAALAKIPVDDGGASSKSLVLRLNPAIGAPGGTIAVVLRTYAPRPVRQGQIVVRVARRPKPAKGLGLTLEDLAAPIRPLTFLSATVYSPKNDALTQGLLNGLADSQLAKVTFQSPSGSVNSADGPLAVFLFRLDPSVQPGDTFDLTLDPVQTGLTDATGKPVTLAPRSDVLTVRSPRTRSSWRRTATRSSRAPWPSWGSTPSSPSE